MAINLYFDKSVSQIVANGLRHRGVDVLTAYEDGTHLWNDADLLDRATQLERILVTHDRDLLREGAKRQQTNVTFAGIIYAKLVGSITSTWFHDLELVAKALEPQEMMNQIVFLPIHL